MAGKEEDDVEMDNIGKKSKGKKSEHQKKSKTFTSPAVSIASFLFAAAQGELALVEHLLDEGTVKVNDCDYDKRTALHVAAAEGHRDVVNTLLKEGADVNFADRYNTTPLDDAIHHGHIEISKLLLERGAKHGVGTNFALDLVSAAGKGDLKAVQRLIENGISIQSSDYDLRTPLHVAIAGRHEEVVRYLLEQGALLDVEDRFGGTPLEEAHRAGVRLGTDSMLELVEKYSPSHEHHTWKDSFSNPFVLTFLFLELIIGVLFAIFAEYGHGAAASDPQEDSLANYPFYTDVHVMIFIGFGFLMTFLRKYGYTAIGLTFILGALCIQVYLLCITFWENILEGEWHRVHINVGMLIKSDFSAGAVLISFGALLGKVTFTQMMLLAVLEVFFFSLNEAVSLKLAIADIGGSMVIHTFGAFFGLAASYALTSDKAKGNKDNAAIYHSDLFSMIGTIFLWMYWPSFNGALSTGTTQHRAIVNTVLSLCASCVFAYICSQLWRKEKVFNMVDIQNATLAGGVAIGSAADMVLHPAFSLLIGALSGTISVYGFSKIQGFVERKLGIHDTCGVLNLHGIPGILGAVVSMIASAAATEAVYGPNTDQLFFIFSDRENRSASRQAQLQLAFLVITLAMSIVTGLLSGKIISSCNFPKRFFLDSESWETPSREVPYYFDIRGEAKHSNDKADSPGSTMDEKMVERAIAGLESKLNSFEDIIREQKRTIQQQAKQISSLEKKSKSGSGSGSGSSSRHSIQPPPAAVDSSLTNLLETLSNKVNFLVEQSKKDS